MNMTRQVLWLLLLAATWCGSSPAAAKQCDCGFRYTPAVTNELVIPELKKNFADAYIYFDFDAPVLIKEPGKIIVQLSATRQVDDGSSINFEDLFFIEIDPCARVVLRSYATQQYHKE